MKSRAEAPRAPSGRPLLSRRHPISAGAKPLPSPEGSLEPMTAQEEVPSGGPPPHHTWGPQALVLGGVCAHVCACDETRVL